MPQGKDIHGYLNYSAFVQETELYIMDNVSMSKGVFAHKGAYKIGKKKKKFEHESIDEPWYPAYRRAWSIIQSAAEEINIDMFKQILSDMQTYVKNIQNDNEENILCEIQTAILLTGINLSDHGMLFRNLASNFSSITDHIAEIPSRDSVSMKHLTEETVFQLINSGNDSDSQPDIRKSQCTFRVLQAWYRDNCDPSTPLIIIIPDFESFNPAILRDFILVLSSYSTSMKFVLILGVATTLHAVHRTLSYDATSKLRVKVFHTQTQIKSLSSVLEGTVLSGKTPFMLTGRAFTLLTDIFLFYDFAVRGFLQGYKLCMIQHFYGNNLTSLCCDPENIYDRLEALTDEDIEELKQLPSIVKYMEKSRKNIGDITLRDFKSMIHRILESFHDSMSGFFVILKCLHLLTFDMPGAPLGKQLREVYANAVTCDIVEMQEYKNCIQLLGFRSKDELLEKLDEILNLLKTSDKAQLKDFQKNLKKHIKILEKASLEIPTDPSETIVANTLVNRTQFSEQLRKQSQKYSKSPFKQAQIDFFGYLDHCVFRVFLVNPNRLPGSEIFCFSDANAAKHHLLGSLRAATWTGLNDPHAYLKCGCCKLENDEVIQRTLPDLSIIYKLHLESRKLINMYDWLQSFLTIVNPTEEANEQREIDPRLQARFTRAVAELEFLGFIKSSRRKTDHVKRLT